MRWREAARWMRDRALLPTWIAVFALWRASSGDQTEAMWMAREGSDVLAGSPLVHPDRWSWAPQPWDFIPTSPAWELLAAACWKTAGAAGLFALTALTVAACLAALVWIAHTLGATPTASIIAMLFCATLASGIMTSRASLPSFVLLLLEFTAAWRWRTRIAAMGGGRAVLLVFGVAYAFASLGIWLHGSWSMFGVVAIGGLCIMLRNAEFGRHRSALGVALTLATFLGMVSGPLGATVWANGARVAAVCRGLIKEWTSPWQLDSFWIWIWLLFAAIAIALTVGVLRRRTPGWYSRLEIPLLLLTLGCVAGGAFAVRFLLLGIVAAMPLLAWQLSRGSLIPTGSRLHAALGERAHEPYWRNIVALLTLLAVPLLVLTLGSTSRAVDAAVTALPRECKLFADDWVTKPVELWRPDIRVWIDGRQDYWGRDRLLLANRYLAGAAGDRMLPAGTTCVLLENGANAKLVRKLQHSGRWISVERSADFTAWALRG